MILRRLREVRILVQTFKLTRATTRDRVLAVALFTVGLHSSNALALHGTRLGPPKHEVPEQLSSVVSFSRATSSPRLKTPKIIDVREERFGAKCDWINGQGTDDTNAFKKAAQAASTLYRITARAVQIHMGGGCRVDSTVRFGSGVHWVGPGTLIVPRQTAAVLLAEDADEVEVSGLTIKVVEQNCGANNAACSAISWQASASDQTQHRHVVIRGNHISHSNWGILIAYAAGQGSLRDVEIRGNTITSPKPYDDADGIHIGGRVTNFLVKQNRVVNRGDAGVAASSEVPNYICSGGIIEDNALIENQIGLDNSGCTNTEWRGNLVYAATAPRGSNPAFRSINYLGLVPDHVLITGNYLHNSAGFHEYAAKVDDENSSLPTHVTFQQNTLDSPLALYLRGSAMRVRGNIFSSEHSVLTLDFNGQRMIGSDDIGIEGNVWRGTGFLNVGDNRALLTHLSLAPQFSTKKVTVTHPGMFTSVRNESPFASAKVGRRIIDFAEDNRSTAAPGDCLSLRRRLPGLTTADNIDVRASANHGQLAQPFVSWGFCEGKDTLVVKICAVNSATFRPTRFHVQIN